MKITLITPANKYSKSGNRTSAARWARLLREQGHKVHIKVEYNGQPTDLLIALHAWRSAGAIRMYRENYPQAPLIVALGGTDVNTYLASDPIVTQGSMDKADILICLHDQIKCRLPKRFQKKLFTIKQSAEPLSVPRKPSIRNFDVCVVGHLREEKDPFRAAFAARLMPECSRLRIIHLGKAHTSQWAKLGKAEMANNFRYIWKGEVPSWRVRQEYVRTHLMVISSNQEGGANVVSEAIMAGVPIIASHIPGNTGLLGPDYPGYYPVNDEFELAKLLEHAETHPKFLRELYLHGRRLRKDFLPKKEAAEWRRIIKMIT